MSIAKLLFTFYLLILTPVIVKPQINVLSQYDLQLLLPNAKTSVYREIVYQASETNAEFDLNVGLYSLHYKAFQPVDSYAITEIGRVPKFSTLHRVSACFSNDPVKFQELTLADDPTASPAQRRLLQDILGIGATIIAGLALSEAKHATEIANAAFDKATAVEATTIALQATTKSIQKEVDKQLEWNQAQGLRIDSLNNVTITQDLQVNELQAQQNRTSAALTEITAKMVEITATEKANLDTLQSQFNGAVDSLSTQLRAALVSQAQLISREHDENLRRAQLQTQAIEQLRENVGGLASRVSDLIRNTQLSRLSSVQLQNEMKKISADFKVIVNDMGAAPIGLSGADRVVSLEYEVLNYITPVSGTLYYLHNIKFKWFLDSEYALQKINDLNPDFNQLLKLFSSSSACQRAYVSDNQIADPASDTSCVMHAEVQDSYCGRDTTIDAGHKFTWENADTTKTFAGQPALLSSSYCNAAGGNGAIVPGPITVLRTLPDFLSYVQVLCHQARDGNYTLHGFRTPTINSFNPDPSTCDMNLDDMFQSLYDTGVKSLAFELLELLRNSFIPSYIDMRRREKLKYGVAPTGGLSYREESVSSVPFNGAVQNYTQSAIDNAAGDLLKCTVTEFLALSKETIPLYSLEYLGTTTTVSVTVDGPICTDPEVCYEVGESNITQNIQLSAGNSLQLPIGSIIVGDLAQAQTNGIADVPARSVDPSPNPYARTNTISYYLMPPGTTETQDLPIWNAANGYAFNPLSGMVAAGTYISPAQFDTDHYPVCGITGGSLDPLTTDNSTDSYGCKIPFHWNADVAATLPSCFPSGVSLIYNHLGDAGYFATASNAFSSSTTHSFWFKSSTILTTHSVSGFKIPLLTVVSSFAYYWHFLVDEFGQAAVMVSSSATTLSGTGSFTTQTTADSNANTILTRNLRDGFIHNIVYESTIYQTSTTIPKLKLEIFIDGVSQGSWTNFPTATFSSGPVVSGTYYDSRHTFAASTVDPDTGFADADTITLATKSGSLLTSADIIKQYACGLANQGDRCSSTSSGNSIVVARQNVTITNSLLCLGSAYLLSVNPSFDVLYPTSVGLINTIGNTASSPIVLFSASTWTLSGWIRIPLKPTTGDLLRYSQGMMKLQIQLNTQLQLKIIVNGATTPIALNTVYDGLGSARYLSITVNTVTHQVVAFLEGVVAATAGTFPDLGSTATAELFTHPYFSMVKYYPGTIVPPVTLQNEMKCMYDSAYVPSTGYLAPIGSCQLTADGTHGYCRQPLLCAGHCSAYSTYDSYTNTFAPGALECDHGYAAPDCLRPCDRVDPVTGECLASVQTLSQGLVPSGFLCQILKYNQCSVNHATKRLTCLHRRFLIQGSSQIPSGQVSQKLGSGGCVLVRYVPYTSGITTVVLSNMQDSPSYVVVRITTEAIENGDQPCLAPCCNLPGLAVTVSPQQQEEVQLPQCGDLIVTVAVMNSPPSLTDLTVCSTDNATSLATKIAIASTQIPVSVSNSIVQVRNEMAAGLAESISALSQSNYDLLLYALASNANQSEIVTTILQAKAQAEQLKYAAVNATFNIANLVTLQTDINAIVQQNADSYNRVQLSNENIAALRIVYNNLTEQLINITAQQNELALVTQYYLNITDQLIKASLAIKKPDGGWSFDSDFFNALKSLATDAVNAVGAAPGFLTNLIGGFGGAIGNWFNGLLNLFSTLLPLILIGVCIWAASKFGLFDCKKNKNKNEGDSGYTTVNLVQQQPKQGETASLLPKFKQHDWNNNHNSD